MNYKTLSLGLGVGIAGFAALRLLTPYYGSIWTMTVQARTYEELEGYFNGLIRGSGSRDKALKSLEDWKNYWYNYAPHWIVDYWYKWALKQVDKIWK